MKKYLNNSLSFNDVNLSYVYLEYENLILQDFYAILQKLITVAKKGLNFRSVFILDSNYGKKKVDAVFFDYRSKTINIS